MSFQQTIVAGNLGGDPVLRATQSGKSVADFSVAVNSRQKVGEEWIDQVQWFKITVWDKTAESCAKWLQKGSLVLVAGRLSVDKWMDRQQVQQFTLVVNADRVDFLGGTRTKEEVEAGIGQPETEGTAQAVTNETNLIEDDEL